MNNDNGLNDDETLINNQSETIGDKLIVAFTIAFELFCAIFVMLAIATAAAAIAIKFTDARSIIKVVMIEAPTKPAPSVMRQGSAKDRGV